MSSDTPQDDERSESKRYDSCHLSTTFLSQNRNMRSGSCVNQQTTQCAYQEDTSKKDQGQTLLDGGSAPPEPDEDGPATMAATTLAVGEDGGTCKAPSK
jgi:hypothetical protein